MPRKSQANTTQDAEIMFPRVLMLLSALALVVIGLLMVYSASFVQAISNEVDGMYYVTRQAAAVALGVGMMIVVLRGFPMSVWEGNITYVAALVVTVVLLCTMAAGVALGGAQRWIDILGVRFQPSEFTKIILVITVAKLLNDLFEQNTPPLQLAAYAFGFVAVPLALILVAQSDLGTTLICCVGVFAAAWAGGVNRFILIGVVLLGIAVVVAAILGSDYRSNRLINMNPWNDGKNGLGDGYQLIHSFYGFAEGGIFGVGLGSGSEKYLYLTQAESDFIFSVIGEELGLVGAMVVVFLFLAFLYAGLQIAFHANNNFACMVGCGLTVMLVFQAFLNIMCATGVLPTTGKPLPFISHGGSSMMSSLVIVGFLWSISRESAGQDKYARKRENFTLLTNEERTKRSYTSKRSYSQELGGEQYAVRAQRGRNSRPY